MGCGEGNIHNVILAANHTATFGFQHADDPEGLTFDADGFTNKPIRSPKKFIGHIGTDQGHRGLPEHILIS